MVGRLEVFAGMFVHRVITASDLTTGHTHAQVYPGISHLQALFTALRIGGYTLDRVPMAAIFVHTVFHWKYAYGSNQATVYDVQIFDSFKAIPRELRRAL